ncbi:MAG: T9SS type A sorting domain-containing protein [Flavobacteriales bacterium]|nr:T9SS type A sorting domain-containing protein [Flavobacteriales bacterium]MCB9365284.1 T9SS type A sorting domain-containing protein [Flavobacteriales bacterium]
MKKYYALFCSIFIGLLITNAQVNLPERQSISVAYNKAEVNNLKKSSTCIDTIRYPESKLTGFIELDTLSPNAVNTVSQAYHFNGSGTIHGLNAYILLDLDGIPANIDSISLVMSVFSLYNYDSDYPNAPGTMIATDTVTVYDVGFAEQSLYFSTPVTVTDSFVLVLGLDATAIPSPLPYYGFNGYGDGLAEKLAWANYLGTWYNCYTDWFSVGGWDSDMMLSPIFEQSFSANYIVDTNVFCLGNEVLFTNTSSTIENAMFNTGATSNNLELNDLFFSVPFDSNFTQVYSTTGIHLTTFEKTHFGYNGNCIDNSSIMVTVLDTAISNFNYSTGGGGSYQFTDMSSNANTYSWDFGDGDTSSLQSPIHTYLTSNNYNACLTVTDSNGCNVNTSCQTVSFVTEVESSFNKEEISIYPIPANKFLNILIPSTYRNGLIVITDVVGKTIKNIEINNQENIKILTQDINSGIYFLSIENNGQKVYAKRILIDKK